MYGDSFVQDGILGDSSLAQTFVESRNELPRRDGAESLSANQCDLLPINGTIKSHSEPAASPNIWWAEESVGLRCDELILSTRRCRTPHMRKSEIVMAIKPQGEELLPYEERWCAVAQLLSHAGKTHAD